MECYQSAYYSLSTYSVSNLVVPKTLVGFFSSAQWIVDKLFPKKNLMACLTKFVTLGFNAEIFKLEKYWED